MILEFDKAKQLITAWPVLTLGETAKMRLEFEIPSCACFTNISGITLNLYKKGQASLEDALLFSFSDFEYIDRTTWTGATILYSEELKTYLGDLDADCTGVVDGEFIFELAGNKTVKSQVFYIKVYSRSQNGAILPEYPTKDDVTTEINESIAEHDVNPDAHKTLLSNYVTNTALDTTLTEYARRGEDVNFANITSDSLTTGNITGRELNVDVLNVESSSSDSISARTLNVTELATLNEVNSHTITTDWITASNAKSNVFEASNASITDLTISNNSYGEATFDYLTPYGISLSLKDAGANNTITLATTSLGTSLSSDNSQLTIGSHQGRAVYIKAKDAIWSASSVTTILGWDTVKNSATNLYFSGSDGSDAELSLYGLPTTAGISIGATINTIPVSVYGTDFTFNGKPVITTINVKSSGADLVGSTVVTGDISTITLQDATTDLKGITQLSDSLNEDSSLKAATAKTVKTLQDTKVDKLTFAQPNYAEHTNVIVEDQPSTIINFTNSASDSIGIEPFTTSSSNAVGIKFILNTSNAQQQLGLQSAAYESIGTAAGNVVALDETAKISDALLSSNVPLLGADGKLSDSVIPALAISETIEVPTAETDAEVINWVNANVEKPQSGDLVIVNGGTLAGNIYIITSNTTPVTSNTLRAVKIPGATVNTINLNGQTIIPANGAASLGTLISAITSASPISTTTTTVNGVTTTAINIDNASTTAPGITQLVDNIDSASTTLVPTQNAVYQVKQALEQAKLDNNLIISGQTLKASAGLELVESESITIDAALDNGTATATISVKPSGLTHNTLSYTVADVPTSGDNIGQIVITDLPTGVFVQKVWLDGEEIMPSIIHQPNNTVISFFSSDDDTSVIYDGFFANSNNKIIIITSEIILK